MTPALYPMRMTLTTALWTISAATTMRMVTTSSTTAIRLFRTRMDVRIVPIARVMTKMGVTKLRPMEATVIMPLRRASGTAAACLLLWATMEMVQILLVLRLLQILSQRLDTGPQAICSRTNRSTSATRLSPALRMRTWNTSSALSLSQPRWWGICGSCADCGSGARGKRSMAW